MAKYKFTGDEGAPISKEQADRWIQNYQDSNPGKVRAHFFGQKYFHELLKGAGSKGIRIFYAKDDFGGDRLVMVGANEDGANLWPEAESGKDGSTYIAVDDSKPCPPYC